MDLIFCLGLLLNIIPALADSQDSILLSKVQSLTLKGHGAVTKHRRAPPVPQLKCVSRNRGLCRLAEDSIDVMRCQNQGSAYGTEDVEWSCSATLPPELALTRTDVICEGYSHAGDDAVLRGSCGVEYMVRLTPRGEERYPHLASGGWAGDAAGDDQEWDWAAVAFSVIFLALLGIIIYSAYKNWAGNNADDQQPRRRAAPRNNGRGGRAPGPGWDPSFGGGGWDNDDDDDDPPPPYPGFGSAHGRNPKRSTGSRSSPLSSGSIRSQESGWRPGFWSGLGAGGLAGYAAGRRAGAQTRDYDAAGPSRYQTRGGGEPVISRPLGSQSRSSGGSDFGSGSGSGFSSTPHTSTGMGGTSRR